MTADEALGQIQKELKAICDAGYTCDLDDWLWDHLRNIQHVLNEYRNREFKPSEPDPFA